MESFIMFVQANNISYRSLFLIEEPEYLNLTDKLDVFQYLSRDFIITTRNGSSTFNSEMLKNSSNVIFEYLQNNQKLEFYLDIYDKTNVLEKFAKLYQGEKVYFNEEDLPACQKITKLLNIINCPYYMKPKELRKQFSILWSNNTDNDDNLLDLCEGVIINKNIFPKFLSNSLSHSFTITTKKNTYKCTICGVCSSQIIYSLIVKNPKLDNFFFDFDDEFDEFQPICDLFNFQKVNMTMNTVNSIKEIATLLKIDVILCDVNKYIKKYECLFKVIDEQQSQIQLIDGLFELLYKIKEKSVDFVKKEIINSFWSKTEDNVKELAGFIIQVIKTDMVLHPYLIDLLLELEKACNPSNNLNILLPFIVKKMIQSFGQSISNCAFIYKLHQKGIISNDEIINKLLLLFKLNFKIGQSNNSLDQNEIMQINNIFVWFLPEVIEINQFHPFLNLIKSRNNFNFVMSFVPDKIDVYKKLRDIGEPENEVTKALRNDDIDTLQSFVSMNQIDVSNYLVPYNIFENLFPNGDCSLLNYAAAYGSIKCFKYLILNHAEIDNSTFGLAVFGGNIEIIKIVDQQNINKKEYTVNDIAYAIKKHRNDLFDWIFEQRYSNKIDIETSDRIIYISARNGNAHSLIEMINKGIFMDFYASIYFTWKKGFYRLSKIIKKIIMNNNKQKDKSSEKKMLMYSSDRSSVSFDNISIFKQYFEMTDKKIVDILHIAIKSESISIIKFIVEKIKNENIEIDEKTIQELFITASMNKTGNEFKYLMSQFQMNFCSIFQQYEFLDILLLNACKYGNFEVIKIVIDSTN